MEYLWIWTLFLLTIDARHFNGGTIRWFPIDPYTNDSSVVITIVQTYSWSYPMIKCAASVPISTLGRSTENRNITCMADCSSDGGYSAKPINILTDCVSASSTLGKLNSERSKNITLAAGAHFYAAYASSAWSPLNDPPQSGLDWSIAFSVDLRQRPDGFINTPPKAEIISPQYTIVNRTSEIRIHTSDDNLGDVVRCRWSVYKPGYRRRKRSEETHSYEYSFPLNNLSKKRQRRGNDDCDDDDCTKECDRECPCNCTGCLGTTCTGKTCTTAGGCVISTTKSTTIDTPGTLKSTSTFPTRQAIDECGGICYPNSLPSGTTLNDSCIITFRGLKAGTWYAVAIQVEDFINETSTEPMSSVPAQFLIYVAPEPYCGKQPIIIPIEDCLEVSVGVTISFNVTVLNLCDWNFTAINDLLISRTVAGVQAGNLTVSSNDPSTVYMKLTWTPQLSQVGTRELCFIAYTDEQVQSEEYCVTFLVKNSLSLCATTSTAVAFPTTVTTVTTSTSTTSSTTITTTVVTTTTTVTTSTSTTSSTTITTTAVTTTKKMSTSTSTVTTITTSVKLTSNTSEKGISWGLIAGLVSLIFPLGFCSICCLYRLLWSPSARKRIREEDEEESVLEKSFSSMKTETKTRTQSSPDMNGAIDVPNRSYQIYRVESVNQRSQSIFSSTSLLSSATFGSDVNCAGSNDAYTGQDRSSHKTLLDSSIGMTPSLGKPEPINGECSIMMKNNTSNGVTLYDQSLDAAESAVENGEDFTKWARRYLYGQNSNRQSARKENQSS